MPIARLGLGPALHVLKPVVPPRSELRQLVTMEHFEQIRQGMTYEQVVEIIGFEGTFDGERQETDDSGNVVRLESYGWKNGSFGGFLNAVFADGRLVQKTQYELPKGTGQ